MRPEKPKNKLRRQALHIRRKRANDSAQRTKRFNLKKAEAKDSRLREQRLRKNVPLTLDRKRTWDDETDDQLGLSVDVERVKRLKLAREEQDLEGLEQAEGDIDEGEEQGPQRDDEEDSMLEFGSEGDAGSESMSSDREAETRQPRLPNKPPLRTATERATSPTQSTTSTNLNLAPDALVAKFPSLFSTDPPPEPKILITTNINSTLHYEAGLLTNLFPNSVYIRRSAHRYGHKFSVKEISSFATNRLYTSVIVLNEDEKRPSGLTVVHLPHGPTFHFTISSWIEGKKLPGHGRPTSHTPELILNNFRTPLGLLTAHLFRSLFPPQPRLEGRQVVTLHNQRDYIFLRRHRYAFRQRRDSEKHVTGTDGKTVKGIEDVRAGLMELGPRITLKLRRIDKGISRASGQEWEWKARMEKTRTKFQL
ncbi:MAG: hypothetical protein Q9227_009466 [Pyrenula ochraceoflavens]